MRYVGHGGLADREIGEPTQKPKRPQALSRPVPVEKIPSLCLVLWLRVLSSTTGWFQFAF